MPPAVDNVPYVFVVIVLHEMLACANKKEKKKHN